jgi:hypothetical protein
MMIHHNFRRENLQNYLNLSMSQATMRLNALTESDQTMTAGSRSQKPSERRQLLAWLASELDLHGVNARVECPRETAVLRVVTLRSRRIQYVVCIPAPQANTWAWVWSKGWALVTDPRSVAMIMEAMTS